MSVRVYHRMRWLLIPMLTGCGLHAPAQQQPPAPRRSFEVASIKPSANATENSNISTSAQGIKFDNVSLLQIILFSFDIRSESQIQGLPPWARQERFLIEAKPDEGTIAMALKLSPDDRRRLAQKMLQSLLAERFQMKSTWGKKELPVYALIVAKSASKASPGLKPSTPPPTPPDADPAIPPRLSGPSSSVHNGGMNVTNGSMALLADQLSRRPEIDGRVVVDQTGLTGNFDFTLDWSPESPHHVLRNADNNTAQPVPAADASKPTLFTALVEQLGLKLEPAKAPVDLLIIDKLERPSEN